MTSSRILYLFERYYDKSYTSAEREELMLLVRKGGEDKALKAILDKAIAETAPEYQLSKKSSDAMLKAIFEAPAPVIVPFYKRYARLGWAAAVMLILAGTGLTYFLNNSQLSEKAGIAKEELATVADIYPGRNRATLTMADGSVIALDSVVGKKIAGGNATEILIDSGLLAFHSEGITGSETAFNTITTPNGGQFSVVLPDGSKVWLNASSTLRFPSAFAKNERVVELGGEGYFEIEKKQDVPFRVKTPQGIEVEVLGTHFNVNAYSDEPFIATTLLEGSVKVGKKDQSRLIKPGEQATLSMDPGNNMIQVQAVDVDNVVAWKNALFRFKEADFDYVQRQLERWYDVDIRYEGKSADIRVNGVVSRDQPLSHILEMLEYTLNIQHKVEGRKVTLYR